MEEAEINIAETVDVPKALGDIFEALIGAIYLDSGKDLNVTWKILYNLMRNEIGETLKFYIKNKIQNSSPTELNFKVHYFMNYDTFVSFLSIIF